MTTSRRPTVNIRSLCKDLSHIFPNVVRINRGKLNFEDVAKQTLELDAEKMMIIERWEEGLGRMEFFVLAQEGLRNVSPTVYLRSAKFRRDFRGHLPSRRIKSVAIVSVSKKNFEVKKFEDFLSGFLDLPILSLERVANGNYDAAMQISMDNLKKITITFKLIPELLEVGPRMVVSHLIEGLMQ